MFRGRGRQLAAAALGCAVIGGALVVAPLTASAQGTSESAVTVTARPASTVTGHGLTIIAKVTAVTADATTAGVMRAGRAATGNASVPTGTVSFIIEGSNDTLVNCKTSNVVTIKHGKAICRVPVEQLTHVASPYGITANYSGDENFLASSGTGSETVAAATTHTKIKVDSKPTSGTGNTFTAVVKAGPGGSLLGGNVLFSVSDTPSQSKALRTCAGGNLQPVAVTGNVGTATCVLAPGWFIVPAANHMTPHPHGAWNVTGSYSGDNNFGTSLGSKSGHSRF
jgi:hypothetical protein